MNRTLLRTDKNGTKYWGCVDRCLKCCGTGTIGYYIPINGGECFDCNGRGIVEWEEKEYTPEYEAKLQAQREKRAAKKLEQEKAKAAELNAEFFQKNGFTPEGKTYFILGNTYDIKEELKAQGAKWDNASRHWHMATKPEGREVVEISVDEMYDANCAGVYDWRNWKSFTEEDHYTKKIEEAESTVKAAESTSQHFGTIGDRLDLVLTYTHTASWENGYGGYWSAGVTNLHTFKDDKGNVFVWKTGKFIEADYGTQLRVTGTVKEHSEYKGVKQTALTRCKINEV